MNIVEPILLQCRWQPSALALYAAGTTFESVTYHQLDRYIHNVSSKVRKLGIKPGSTAALFIKDPILHAIFILGLAHAGVASVAARISGFPSEFRPDTIFSDDPPLPSSAPDRILVDKEWAIEGDDNGMKLLPVQFDADAPCRINLTAGTTGNPKAIARSSRWVFAQSFRTMTNMGSRLSCCSRIFVDLGLSTGIGYVFLIYTLIRGGSFFTGGVSPQRTIDSILRFRVQAYVGAPKGLAELAELSSRGPDINGVFEVVVSVGSTLSVPLIRRIEKFLCPHIVTIYGSSESGHVAACPAEVIVQHEGAVGYIAPGVDVDIVDDAGTKLPAGASGLLRVRSDSVVAGYIGDPELTRSKFRREGFYPGDVGFMTPDGVLVVSGRRDTVINVGGEKVSPEYVEAILASFPSISDAGVFGVPTVVGVNVLAGAIVWKDQPDFDGLKEFLFSKLPRAQVPVVFISVDAIPRNAGGKIERGRLRSLAARLQKNSS